uniref:Uncharacterized protein n=1 Tax=Anopheles merus TaxID=30066 RepID=A0A182UWZ2_ANOME
MSFDYAMKAVPVLLLLLVAAVCSLADEQAAAPKGVTIPKAPLTVDFAALAKDGALTKERLEQFRQAVEAFKSRIDATRMNTAHREAIKKEALTRLAERIAKLKQQVPKKPVA